MNILLSVRPKWASLIALGEKKGEARKSRPKLKTPFRCFLYCTSIKSVNLDEYIRIHTMTGGRIDEWQGRVFCEFTCEEIEEITKRNRKEKTTRHHLIYANRAEEILCMSLDELWAYSKDGDLYIWHISDLKVYEDPRPLSDFVCRKPLKMPPQSWCYVEDPKEGSVLK